MFKKLINYLFKIIFKYSIDKINLINSYFDFINFMYNICIILKSIKKQF